MVNLNAAESELLTVIIDKVFSQVEVKEDCSFEISCLGVDLTPEQHEVLENLWAKIVVPQL